jgi:hypothetical protein
MTQKTDPVLIALIATLEEKTLKSGKKSVLKSVLKHLTEAQGSQLLEDIAALSPADEPVVDSAPASEAAPEPTAEAAPTERPAKTRKSGKSAKARDR